MRHGNAGEVKDHTCVAVVCQVRSPLTCLPAFLAHHQRLACKIFLIDHDPYIDLQGLASEEICVFRSRIADYALDISWNSIIDKVVRHASPDWIFVLDVDEFLPFSTEHELRSALYAWRHLDRVAFQWNNGIRIGESSSERISAKDKFLFGFVNSSVTKWAFNAKKSWPGYIRHGNHSEKHGLRLGRRIKRLRRGFSQVPLLHIPAVSLETLIEKNAEFPAHNFAVKLEEAQIELLQLSEGLRSTTNVNRADIASWLRRYRERNKDGNASPQRVSATMKPVIAIAPDTDLAWFLNKTIEVQLFDGLERVIEAYQEHVDRAQPRESSDSGIAFPQMVTRIRKRRFTSEVLLRKAVFVDAIRHEISWHGI